MKKVSVLALSLLAAAHISAASASDGKVTFTGLINSQTCTASSPVVDLPPLGTSALTAAAQIAGEIAFSIDLTNCSPTTGNVYAYFEQGSNVNANGRLNNTGTATNVDLQLLDSAKNLINLGTADQTSSAATVPLSNGQASLPYTARYYATGPVTAGSVASSVTFSIVYL